MAATLVPAVDEDNAGFWDAARRHQLAICRCGSCHAPIHLPRSVCPRCHEANAEWTVVSGLGRVHSWTTVEHQVHPAYPVPYTVVLVELVDEPSVRLVGTIAGRPALAVGTPMRVWFQQIANDMVLPQWQVDPTPEPQEGT